jgi:NAD(P)-dependent dehydrogenase (short-subunit alcohol dehydrogenase family)
MNTTTRKTVIITGGNKGIGEGITRVFLDAGYDVVIGAREKTSLFDNNTEHLHFVPTDVRHEESHKALVAAALEKTGRLDVYINNAGLSGWKPLAHITDEFIDHLVSTNLKSVIWGCKAAIGAMPAGGVIINISSLAGKRGSTNNTVYCATKFAVNGITQSLAKELGPQGIRVNALCPVLVTTSGLLEALAGPDAPGGDDPAGFIDNFRKANAALGRLPTGEEVGDMALLLAGEQASAITGQCINVDCGVFPQ